MDSGFSNYQIKAKAAFWGGGKAKAALTGVKTAASPPKPPAASNHRDASKLNSVRSRLPRLGWNLPREGSCLVYRRILGQRLRVAGMAMVAVAIRAKRIYRTYDVAVLILLRLTHVEEKRKERGEPKHHH